MDTLPAVRPPFLITQILQCSLLTFYNIFFIHPVKQRNNIFRHPIRPITAPDQSIPACKYLLGLYGMGSTQSYHTER